MTRPLRVGIRLSPGLAVWPGGLNYVNNLLRVLRRHASGRVEPVLFAGPSTAGARCGGLASRVDGTPVMHPAFDAANGRLHAARTVLTGSDAAAARALAPFRLDVVLEQGTFFGHSFPVPVLTWLPDFQHRHLPGMFGRAGYLRRELAFRLRVGSSRTIMVSSEAARADCIRFYGVRPERIAVVPFAVEPENTLCDTPAVRAKYDVPERYLFLPNQAWRHKNHQLVLEALLLARRCGQDVLVVASGSTQDHRNPEHFAALMQFAAGAELESMFRHLGAIPHDHVLALLRGATAVINPSLFEGWSTTVEEAKTFGVPMLISDIPVHREQANGRAMFFDPSSAGELAGLLRTAWETLPPGPRPLAESAALDAAHDRARRFATDFESALRQAAQTG